MDKDYCGYLPDKERPTDLLTRNRLPPDLEIAEAEYFADMAFDDRLHLLLEGTTVTTYVDIENTTHGTLDGLASLLFAPNTVEPVNEVFDAETTYEIDMPAFSYKMRGYMQKTPTRLEVDATITPIENHDKSIRIQSNHENDDSFFISSNDIENFTVNSVSLFYLFCQLGGAKEKRIDTLYSAMKENRLDKTSVIQDNIAGLWQQLGETHGETTMIKELRHSVEHPANSEFPEHIKLRHETNEKPHVTITRLYLEHATEMHELDVESSYCLKLEFEQQTGHSTNRNAERITVTGISTPQLVSLDFGRKLKGRITPLDVETIQIKELFVDWFDQIVSA